MKNRFLLLFLGFTIFIAGGVSSRWWLEAGGKAHAADEALPVQQLQELTEIYDLIQREYVEEVDGGKLINQAMRGMIGSLDPHSSYLNVTEYNNFIGGLTNQEYGGVGIYIGTKNDWIEVVSPIHDSPAQRAGLNAGDLILKIEGESTHGMPVDDAVKKMRGVVDTVLEIDVLPVGGGEVRHVELVRETIVTPSVLSSLVDDGYGYLRITRFQDKTLEDLVSSINVLYEENGAPLKGIVLDLRNNPGGYLNAGIGAAAVFLPVGATVVAEKKRAQEPSAFVARPAYYNGLNNWKLLQDVPLVVMVNNGSASASEIVAGALQDYRRAVIMGTRTYGKASVQRLMPLRSSKGKSAVRLTTARYYTPLDRNIQARGIEPDIVVNQAEVTEQEEGFAIREGDIVGHLENSTSGEEVAKDAAEPTKPSRPPFIDEEDYQYTQALQIVKALAVTASR